MTESAGNAGLPGTVKRESDIKQTRSVLYHFMITSPKLFLVNKVWYVWENNLIHAYFRNKMTLSRDLKLQYLQKPSAQYTMTAKNCIIRQETEYQTGITTTLWSRMFTSWILQVWWSYFKTSIRKSNQDQQYRIDSMQENNE